MSRPYGRFLVPPSLTENSGVIFLKQRLVYAFGLWSLTIQLVLSSAPVYAEWLSVEKPYLSPRLQALYVDLDSIHRQGNLVTLWQLIDFRWMQGNAGMGPLGFGPHRFLSTTTQKQFDCRGKRVRLLAFTEYSHHMGTGIPANGYVDPDNWIPIAPGSINEALWEIGCAKE
jgi:hypothetical protein